MSATDTEMQESLHVLYSEHHGWLRGWLRRRLGCRNDAEDLTQDTFVRVIKTGTTVGLEKPRNYLVTIARGLAVDLFRRRSIERKYLDVLAGLPLELCVSEEEQAIILETLLQLDAMLDGLGHKVKQVFILSQFEGMTYPQIAATLNISLRSVNIYMSQAIQHCCLFRLEHQL